MTTFRNFGFENGTLGGWVAGGGSWNGGAAPEAPSYLPGGSHYDVAAAEIAVTSSQTDSRTDDHLDMVFDGAHSTMINSAAADNSVSVLSQEIDDFNGKTISFAYAGVLQQSHETGEADGFSITLTDQTTGRILFAVAYDSSTAQDTFTLSSSGWYYQGWQTVAIDGREIKGHDLTLDVLAYDCSLGGHAGYVYFDGFDLATGRVAGSVFHEFDASGTRDTKEPVLTGWTVYVDTDGDGVRDVGEASAVTDANGRYALEAVAVGTATIRVDVPTGTWEAWMAQPGTVEVREDETSQASLGVTGGATPFADTLFGVKDVAETIDGSAGDDYIAAHGGDDRVSGGIGDDVVRAGDGDDEVAGGGGDDEVTGGLGDDTISGGAGTDVLKGRSGADVFVFSDDFGRDTIRDFSSADHDKIEIAVAGVQQFSDLVLTRDGKDTIVTLTVAGHQQITLHHVPPSSLTADDFVFTAPAAASLMWSPDSSTMHAPSTLDCTALA